MTMSPISSPLPAAAGSGPRGRLHAWRRRVRRHGRDLLLITPFLLVFAVFVVWPVLRSAWLSFTEYHATTPPRWVGWRNYADLFADDRFWRALGNTFGYMLAVSVLSLLLGLVLALAFGSQSRRHQFARVAFFLPSVAAGLRGIPATLYEAARLDGATRWQQLRHITLPLLRPTLLYVGITGMIASFQVFFEPYILFGSVDSIGGPLDSALMLVTYLFDHGFHQLDLGFASAVAWVLTSILFLLTWLNLRLTRGLEVSS